jgi:hypothetical protein
VTENPVRNELLPSVKRFAERKESKRILSSLYGSLESGYYPTSSGVLIRREHFLVDGGRLDAFARRVVRALFYREKGHSLPNDCMVHTIHYRRFGEAQRLVGPDRDFYDFIREELTDRSQRQSWGGVFAYYWLQSPNHPDATWWLLEFYGKRLYLCNTFCQSSI